MDMRAADADFLDRFDEIDGVIIMLFNARCHRKHVGIKDDVFWRKTDADQQLIRSLANLDLAGFGVGLANLIKRHHDHSRAVIHAFARLFKELGFAFFHADRIDDWLARNAFEARLND